MIGRLTGILAEKSPPQLLIDVNGVGYEVDVPMSSFYNLPSLGERVTLLTHFVGPRRRADPVRLPDPRRARDVRQLVKISGVGPAHCAAILSGLSVNELAQPVSLQGERTPREGARHRQEDRPSGCCSNSRASSATSLAAPTRVASDAQGDILQALLALGYSDREPPRR
jgi:Holliday junction DNA helicase RuvA